MGTLISLGFMVTTEVLLVPDPLGVGLAPRGAIVEWLLDLVLT